MCQCGCSSDKPKEKQEKNTVLNRSVIMPTPCSNKLKEQEEKNTTEDGDEKKSQA